MSTDTPMPAGEESRDPLEELAESFLERHRCGERPTVKEYVDGNPGLARQIRDLFPTLLAMEELGPADDTEKGVLSPVDCSDLTRLGEYRILGEIGRGGMGIVYEAEQESLGRRVALKVLPFKAFADEVQLERFRLEARAAARLHHTNIVPVFGVGEDEGVHYYAMQYIRGQSLADVLAEVKRLREGLSTSGPEPGGPVDSAVDVALRLVSGEWKAEEADTKTPEAVDWRHHGAPTETVEVTEVRRLSPEAGPGGNLLAGDSSTTAVGDPNESYFRSVARLGLQVAEALSYAHCEGILHRDIKPANLLLDLRGVVWVTDFGLAKADGSSDLTDSGNIVGTLRYIAPERLGGEGDARSDLYSLGVTLYELLTLRPAFPAVDRAQLMQDVMAREPQPLRRVDPRIPRDLETVVLKAIAKAPQDRYRGAQELADDLRRFINFEPVAARRATAPERLWRWCQRNPTVATLSAAIAALVVTLAIGGVISAGRLHDRLMAAKLEEGRAWRRSGVLGQRAKSLEAFREAAVGSPIVPLRNEIIGSLALTDLVVAGEWDSPEGFLGYDRFAERLARNGPDHRVLIFDSPSEAVPVASLEGVESAAKSVVFSPSSHYLVVKHARSGVPSSVWNIDREELLFRTPKRSQGLPAAFSPDESLIALAESTGTIVLRSLPDGREIRRFPVSTSCRVLEFAPDGRRLAISGWSVDRHVVHVVDIDTEKVISRFHHRRYVTDVTWHPEGDLLAAACFDFNVHVWDTRQGRRARVLRGHLAEVTHLRYSPDGSFLATTGWDNHTFLWPADAKLPLVSAPGFAMAFQRDSRGLLYRLGHYRQGRWLIEGGREHRLLDVNTLMPTEKTPRRVAVSRDGRWIAAGTHRGVHIWSSARPSVAMELPIGSSPGLAFDPRDGSLLVGQADGTTRWPVRLEATGGGEGGAWTFGPPEPVVDVGGRLSLDDQGRILAVVHRGAVHVFDLDRPEEPMARLRHANVARLDVSPSGRWVASGTWQGRGVRVWNVESGEIEKEFAGASSIPRFSPDGKWIAVSRGEHTKVYETGTWREHLVVPRERGSDVPVVAEFTSDSRLIGISPGHRRFTLFSLRARVEVATLEQPDGGSIGSCVFSPDDSFLAVASSTMQTVRMWDLRGIRDQLATFDLDWEPALPLAKGSRSAAPAAVGVDYGKGGPSSPARLSSFHRRLFLNDVFSRAVELDPSPTNYKSRAEVLEQLGDLEDAVHDLGRAIELVPDDDDLLEKRGRLYLRLKNREAALEDLDRVTTLRRSRFTADPSIENREALGASLSARASVRDQLGDIEGAGSDRAAAERLEETASRAE